jgi:hypothetical protein
MRLADRPLTRKEINSMKIYVVAVASAALVARKKQLR